MESHPCPKCKHAMDTGRISPTGSGFLGYVSDKQPGMLKQVTILLIAKPAALGGFPAAKCFDADGRAVGQHFGDAVGDLGGIVAHADNSVGAELVGMLDHPEFRS